jgi:hypothetical protein
MIADEFETIRPKKVRSSSLRIRYVRINKFCEETGYSDQAIYEKVRDGVWRENVHYRRAPDGHVLVDLEAYEAWVEEGPIRRNG